MSVLEVLAIVLAGVGAGAINTIVGSGTLLTFPTLLFFGVPAVTANMSNSIGLVAGGMSGAWGYRRELKDAGAVIARLAPASLLGAITGALLLLWLPSSVFDAIVPVLIGIGILLVVIGPRMQAAVRKRRADGDVPPTRWGTLTAGIFLAGAYGGYFGAAQGVILMGLMGVLLHRDIQTVVGIKNVLGLIVNFVAATVFIIVAFERIDWVIAALIAAGSFVGGVLGAKVGRSLSPWVLRGVIVVVGLAAIIHLLVS